MKRGLFLALALALFAPGTANAAPILFEDFDTDNAGIGALNFDGFANFNVTDGTVDLIPLPSGEFDFLPGNGLYVDLEGTSADPGLLASNPIALGAGQYNLSFDLAGSQRPDGSNTVTIRVYGNLDPSYGAAVVVLPADFPFTQLNIPFTLAAGDTIRFSFSNSGVDDQGALLDNVALETVPEPAALLLLGLGAVGALFRSRRTRLASK